MGVGIVVYAYFICFIHGLNLGELFMKFLSYIFQ